MESPGYSTWASSSALKASIIIDYLGTSLAYLLVRVTGIEAEPLLVSIVIIMVPVIEFPLKVPVNLPVTVVPPGVTKEVENPKFGIVPETGLLDSQGVLEFRQVKLGVLPATAVLPKLPDTLTDPEYIPLLCRVIVKLILPENVSAKKQVVPHSGNGLANVPEPLKDPI